MGIEIVYIVEKSEIVVDLKDDGTDGGSKSAQVDVANPFSGGRFEERLRITEEWAYLHPSHDVVNDPRAVEESRGG